MQVQILDVDYIVMGDKPLVRIYGRSKDGKSVCVIHQGFYPYFYVRPQSGTDEQIINKITERFSGVFYKAEKTERFLPFGYQDSKIPVLKIYLKDPAMTPEVREFVAAQPECKQIFEADILFKYRFMCDLGLKAMNWIEVDGTTERTSTVDAERIIEAKSITPLEMVENVPLKYLALDIEVIPSAEGLPNANKDPIIMMSLAFFPEHRGQRTMVLSTRDGAGVTASADEKEMLNKFTEIVKDYDPDIITGYNINNFDMPYILDRMRNIGVKRNFGRAKDKSVMQRKTGTGFRINCIGRMVVDSYAIVKKESKVNSSMRFKRYTLAVIAKGLLGREKLDVGGVGEFKKLWEGPREGYSKLVDYSRRDAELALDLVIEKNMLDKHFELSKVSGLLMQDVLDGGEAVRIENYLLQEFFQRQILFPSKPSEETAPSDAEYKGGLVLEPETGLHHEGMVIVLDFKSLYPSIIRTFNICPTTLTTIDDPQKVIVAPSGAKFIRPEVQQGVFPKILTHLVEQRGIVKKQMKNADGEMRRMLDAKQHALKIMANAFYGYSGYQRARLYVLDVATAITSYGRMLISESREKIQKNYGHRIIYGDTDSVMIKTDLTDLEQADALGHKISEEISEALPGVLELDYEKLFKSFLILTKKRYAAWKFEKSGDKWKDKLEYRGIETVRRDWCDLVGEVLENVLATLLKEGDQKKAMTYVRQIIDDLDKGKIPIDKLVVTKSISKSIEAYDGMVPHVELAKKMKRRNPANAPVIGERIGYVILKGTQILSLRAEDPDYVKEKNLHLDSKYYLENQLLPPLERIFGAIGISKNEILGRGRQSSIFEIAKPVVQKAIQVEPEAASIVEGFICDKCERFYQTPPLRLNCDCGGSFKFASPQGPAELYQKPA